MQKIKGSSFIEILVSLFIISVMLLGLDSLQLVILQHMKSANYSITAIEQLVSMKERISSVSDNEIENQYMLWNRQNKQLLPSGRGLLTGQNPEYKLSIFWGNNNENECNKTKVGLSGCLFITVRK